MHKSVLFGPSGETHSVCDKTYNMNGSKLELILDSIPNSLEMLLNIKNFLLCLKFAKIKLTAFVYKAQFDCLCKSYIWERLRVVLIGELFALSLCMATNITRQL